MTKKKNVPKPVPMTKDQATEAEWHNDHAKSPEAPKPDIVVPKPDPEFADQLDKIAKENRGEHPKCTDATCPACHPELHETNGIPNDVEEALTIAEHLLLTRYKFTSKEAKRFGAIVRTQLKGGALPTKKLLSQKSKTPMKTLLRSKPVTVLQPGVVSPDQQKEIEARTKRLEEELRKKGLLMEGKKEAQ